MPCLFCVNAEHTAILELLVVQMRCVETLLKAGAAMTLEQLTIIIHALPTLQDPKVLTLLLQLGTG